MRLQNFDAIFNPHEDIGCKLFLFFNKSLPLFITYTHKKDEDEEQEAEDV